MTSRPARHRYCRCGTHLAADNPGLQCARCERASRDKLIAPPEVPAEFWQTEQFTAAFAAQHMGWVARTYRTHPYHHAVYGPSGIPRLFGDDDGTESGTIFTAAAALTEMAGWMAHDAGRDQAAKQHFGRSLALVQIGGDHQLGAHVLGSMSHLANHLSQPDEAIALARQGRRCFRTEQLLELQRLLQSHRANSVVSEFLTCLAEALHERQWLYQWLAKDRRRFTSGH